MRGSDGVNTVMNPDGGFYVGCTKPAEMADDGRKPWCLVRQVLLFESLALCPSCEAWRFFMKRREHD